MEEVSPEVDTQRAQAASVPVHEGGDIREERVLRVGCGLVCVNECELEALEMWEVRFGVEKCGETREGSLQAKVGDVSAGGLPCAGDEGMDVELCRVEGVRV